jgi:hypothetical protein
VREHDRIHALDRRRQRVGTGEVTHHHFGIGKQFACFSGFAGEGPYGVVLPDGLLHDETSNATGGTDNEHGHALIAHAWTSFAIR